MTITKVADNYFEIEDVVKEMIYGNSIIDKLQGWPVNTNLKIRCYNCTIMVFKKNFENFENVSIGDKIKIYATEWKPRIFHFQKFVQK